MALYAHDTDDIIAATDAKPNGKYWCLECSLPVQIRRGRNRIPHFYHLQLSPSCRLYSKSEDHLLIQLEMSDLLPKGETKIEHPFPEIGRISDLIWENKKIAFEIQCSLISPKEAARRVKEYGSLGIRVVWILDDRIYNKRILRPEEQVLRESGAYFASFHRTLPIQFYDQYEIFSNQRRIRKSRKYPVEFASPHLLSHFIPPDRWPKQVIKRGQNQPLYFSGDLLDRAIQSKNNPSFALSMDNWTQLEQTLPQKKILKRAWQRFWDWFWIPLMERLDAVLTKWG